MIRSGSPLATRADLMMMDVAFQPAVTAVAVGGAVTWTDHDTVAHTEGSGAAPAQRIQPGQSWSWTFAKAGDHAYDCLPHGAKGADGLHKGMTGAVRAGSAAPDAPVLRRAVPLRRHVEPRSRRSWVMREMRQEDARELLRQGRVGVLALARGGDAYGLPVYYAFDGRHVYFHTRPGAKTPYLGATREACFTIVIARSADEWASVMVFGALDRVDGTPSHLAAMHALMAVPLPPEWGVSEAGEPKRGGEGAATYRLTPARVSGRFSQREVEPSALEVS